jgi:hypothetical protein
VTASPPDHSNQFDPFYWSNPLIAASSGADTSLTEPRPSLKFAAAMLTEHA